MEDENYLNEQISMLQAHYNYIWANNYSNKNTPFGKERKELLADVSRQIEMYQKRLDIAKTINQIEALVQLYKNMLKEVESHMICDFSNIDQEKKDQNYLTKEIKKLEGRLFELNQLI